MRYNQLGAKSTIPRRITMRFYTATSFALAALCLLGLIGCGKGQPGAPGGSAAPEEHAHDDEGPHGGHIIELGTEEYHAELTHAEDSHKVGIYLLGKDAKTAMPIEAASVNIIVKVDDKPSQYVLPAVPQEGETGGKSSYFELDSEPLHTVVSGESEAKSKLARLSLDIAGKAYGGVIETEAHDHEHGHEH
jgi:hypothetical protein